MIKGKCACGACSYEANQEPDHMFHCACSDCRAGSGVGHFSMAMVNKGKLHTNGPLKSFEMIGGSGMPTHRNFCETCGTPVFNTTDKYPEIAFVHAATLEEPSLFKPTQIAFEEDALAWDFKKPEQK